MDGEVFVFVCVCCNIYKCIKKKRCVAYTNHTDTLTLFQFRKNTLNKNSTTVIWKIFDIFFLLKWSFSISKEEKKRTHTHTNTQKMQTKQHYLNESEWESLSTNITHTHTMITTQQWNWSKTYCTRTYARTNRARSSCVSVSVCGCMCVCVLMWWFRDWKGSLLCFENAKKNTVLSA